MIFKLVCVMVTNQAFIYHTLVHPTKYCLQIPDKFLSVLGKRYFLSLYLYFDNSLPQSLIYA